MNIIEAEKLVRAELGDNHTPVKLGRYWLIHRRNADDSRDLVAQTGSLAKSIAVAKVAS